MNVERMDRIVYRFRRREVSALLQLMGIEALPGMGISAEYPDGDTVASLASSGIVLPCGERMLTDKVVALVFESVAKSKRYILARSAEAEAVLYECDYFCVLVENTASIIVKIEPIRNLQSAADSWMHAIRNIGKELTLGFATENTMQEWSGNINTAMELLIRFQNSEVQKTDANDNR